MPGKYSRIFIKPTTKNGY